MLFLIAQIKRFGTLNAMQKNRSPLQSTVLEKTRITARNWPFLPKNAFFTIFRQFLLIFSRTMLCRGQKDNRSRKKFKLKKKKKKNLKDCTKWNRKMGGRSCFITSGAFGHGLVYRRLRSSKKNTKSKALTKLTIVIWY